MIQYYLDLKKQVKAVADADLSYGQIQKIYSTAFYLSLSIRARGRTIHLYLGRGGGYEGVWLGQTPPPSALRRKDNFLEYLRRHLSSCSFCQLTLDEYDRILRIDYMKFGQQQSFLLFWKGRKLYFLHYFQDEPEGSFKLLLSWRGKAFVPGVELLDLPEYFDDIGRNKEMSHDFQSQKIPDVSELLQEELKAAALKDVSSRPNFLQRKKVNIEDDLRRAQQWNKLQKILDKGEPLENIYELKVGDHKIKFEGELNPYERRNLLFQKIKKLKRGETILKERLGTVEDELAGKDTKEVKKESTIPIIKPVWGEESPSNKAVVRKESEEYKVYRFTDYQIGVGLNAHGNDQLRNKWAGKEDHWVHLDGLKSTHVIVKLSDNSALSADVLNIAASLVARFSDFQDDWIPIIHTQVKNLKGVSGAAGMVIYKKEKHLRCPRVDLDSIIKD